LLLRRRSILRRFHAPLIAAALLLSLAQPRARAGTVRLEPLFDEPTPDELHRLYFVGACAAPAEPEGMPQCDPTPAVAAPGEAVAMPLPATGPLAVALGLVVVALRRGYARPVCRGSRRNVASQIPIS
jgi:hypothetical protein